MGAKKNQAAIEKRVEKLLADGKTYDYIEEKVGVSRPTVAKVAKRLKLADTGAAGAAAGAARAGQPAKKGEGSSTEGEEFTLSEDDTPADDRTTDAAAQRTTDDDDGDQDADDDAPRERVWLL